MLKHIPKSDINLRPFKVYKTFTFTEGDINALLAYNHTGSTDVLSDTELSEQGLYHQLYTMYYRDPNNPFTSYGDIQPTTSTIDNGKQRLLVDRAKVIAIPQIKYGEQIKPFSVNIYDNQLNESIYDDGHGNLLSNYNSYLFKSINIETGDFIFYDANNNEIETIILTLDIENNILFVKETDEVSTTFYLLTIDVNAGTISFLGIFKNKKFDIPTIGNVFYSHGLIVITKLTQLGNLRENVFTNFDVSYKSTNTIFENEILLVVGEDEFNVSTNPTSYTESNIQTGSIYVSDSNILYEIVAGDVAGGFVNYYDQHNQEQTIAIEPNNTYNFYANKFGDTELINCSFTESHKAGVKWRNSDKYQKPIFAEYEYSSSIDPVGSYLAPYITTIGLYDSNMDMVAVAKLATPIKSTPDLPVNFLVRFDT